MEVAECRREQNQTGAPKLVTNSEAEPETGETLSPAGVVSVLFLTRLLLTCMIIHFTLSRTLLLHVLCLHIGVSLSRAWAWLITPLHLLYTDLFACVLYVMSLQTACLNNAQEHRHD